MKLCILESEHPRFGSNQLIKEGKKQFDEVFFAHVSNVSIKAAKTGVKITCGSRNLEQFDCIFPRINGIHRDYAYTICKLLENSVYMPIRPEGILLAHDKFLTLIEMQRAKVSIPLTYLSMTTKSAEHALDHLNYPIVIKLPSGWEGKGVMFSYTKGSALALLDTIETLNNSILLEEYIKNTGTDVRAFVIGNEVVGAMKRIAKKDEHRSNITLGGSGEKIELSNRSKKLAVKAAKAVGLGIAGVDIMGKANDIVIEVNTRPGLEGMVKYVDKTIPRQIITHLRKETEKHFKQK